MINAHIQHIFLYHVTKYAYASVTGLAEISVNLLDHHKFMHSDPFHQLRAPVHLCPPAAWFAGEHSTSLLSVDSWIMTVAVASDCIYCYTVGLNLACKR